MTQACADVLSQAVREHTHDWHMMQRVFTKDLDGDRVSESAPSSRSADSTSAHSRSADSRAGDTA